MFKIQTNSDGVYMQFPDVDSNVNGAVDKEQTKLKHTGIVLIRDGKAREATQVLEAFLNVNPNDGHARSFLGLACAMTQKGKKGLQLCREAAENHPFDAEIQHNLGRVYLMAGRRQMAWETFILASRLDNENDEIHYILQNMGERRPPIVPSLPRNHPVNIWTGRLLKRMGIR